MTNEEHIEQLKKLRSFHNGSYGRSINKAIEALEQEPKTGHWVGIDEYPHEDYECNNCGFIHTFIDGHTAQYNFCPNCGAEMREGES